MQDPTPTPPEQTVVAALPWEDPAIGGTGGLFQTVSLFLTRPDEAFSRMSPTGLGRPFFYAVIMAWVELTVICAYWVLFQFPIFFLSIPHLREEFAEAAIGTGVIAMFCLGIFVLMPVFVAIGLAIHSCILHLMLLITGEGKGGFESTIRVICYSHTADLANAIPFCGGLISLIWFVALQIIGISRAHHCSYGKAALAVFLPILLCCSCVAVLFSIAGVAALAD